MKRSFFKIDTGASKSKKFFSWIAVGILSAILFGMFVFTVSIAVLSVGLPDVRDFDKLAGVESTRILDRKGGILYTIHGEENRKYVSLDGVAPLLQKATVAIEDSQFFEHSGFDLSGISAAALHEILGIGAQRGGSTITQQLAKNAFLTSRKKLTRKLKELILAVRLERAYDKNKILELYLNRIPYGNNAYGAEMAAHMYFGKTARELTLAESVILASLPNAPTYYSPFGPHIYSQLERELTSEELTAKTPASTQDLKPEDYSIGLIGRKISFSPADSLFIPGRADLVLRRMKELSMITETERATATDELQRIEFTKQKEAIRAAHFVFQIRSELEQRFGKEIVGQGGLEVHTTLAPDLQRAAEDAITDQIKISKDAHGISTAALFSIDAKTGEVLSMVGAADYFDKEAHGNVNHVFAKRQPGSTFKPIIYAKAFLSQYAPATVLYDTPTNFGNNYEPQNYEGGFRGPMAIRQALGQSRNLPALKAYFLAGQQEEIIPFAQKLGIASLRTDGDYGPPLAIGAGETTLAEMVQAFSVFAAGGQKQNFFDISKVLDRNGDVIYERKAEESIPEQALDPQAAYLINNILSDKSVYLGPRLDVPGHTTAAKTGTSNKELSPTKILPSNVWTIGYTPSIVTGVWAGNSDGSALKLAADGYNVAAPIWASFMKKALEGKPDEKFIVPEGIKTITVSKASGKLPSAQTPESGRVSEVFASFSIPTEVDDVYAELDVNKLDGKLPNEFTPPEQIEKRIFMNHKDPISTYGSWAVGVKKWVEKKHAQEPSFSDFPPTEKTIVFNEENYKLRPSIQISSPPSYLVTTDRKISVEVNITAPNGISRVSYYLGDRETPTTTVRKSPWKGFVQFSRKSKPGVYVITAKVFDKIGYVAEAKVEIRYDGDTGD